MPVIVRVVPVALVGLGGAYFYADYEQQERMRAFRVGISEISYERGGNVPSEASVTSQVERLATEHNVRVENVQVTAQNESGLDATARLAPAGALLPGLQMQLRRYNVTGTAHTSKWIFSRDNALNATFTLRTSVTAAPGRGPRGDVFNSGVLHDEPNRGRGF